MPYEKVLVCGGRDYDDPDKIEKLLSALDPSLIIEGGATGADALARWWGMDNGVHICTVPAQWNFYGKQAGPIRNSVMLSLKPDLVVAFPGGRGTADMVEQAKAVGIEVLEVQQCLPKSPQSGRRYSKND